MSVSDRAAEAAIKDANARAMVDARTRPDWTRSREQIVRDALAAACDPSLGLDRLVRLGDVVEWLERNGADNRHGWQPVALRYAATVLAAVEGESIIESSTVPSRGEGKR